MKYFNQVLSLCLMVSTTVCGFAIPSDNSLPIDTVAKEASMALARRQGNCISAGIRPRGVDRAHQINFSWVIREEGRTDWNPNNNVHVHIDAQTTEIDRHLTVEITNRAQRFGNAVILSRYAGNTNTGPIQDQIRIEVGTATGRTPASVSRCVELPSIQGTWWWQLEN